jgi:fido (protein-threonine AMPylation protein)
MPPPDPQSSADFAGHVVSFGLGVGASAIIGIPIYLLQRRSDEKKQRKATMEMYLLWREGQGREDILKRIESRVSDIQEGKGVYDQQTAILGQYQLVDDLLSSSFKKGDSSDYVEGAIAYKSLADAFADTKIVTDSFSIVASDGSIQLDRITSAHLSMFPVGYTWAGRMRTHSLTIAGHFTATSRTVNPMLSSIITTVLPPDEIVEKLDGLIDRWNSNIQFLVGDSVDTKVAELASFHQEFLLIHPFTDGNGRISRIILNEQASFLFGKTVRVSFPNTEYFEALHLADLRQPDRLRSLIATNIEQDDDAPKP